MHLGSDDQAKFYLNGELLFRFDEERSFDFDQNVIDHVQLQAGVNGLVFKLVNGVLDWRGAIRFTDEAGRRVEGVTFTLNTEGLTSSVLPLISPLGKAPPGG